MIFQGARCSQSNERHVIQELCSPDIVAQEKQVAFSQKIQLRKMVKTMVKAKVGVRVRVRVRVRAKAKVMDKFALNFVADIKITYLVLGFFMKASEEPSVQIM